MGIILESSPADRKVAKQLAKMATEKVGITYTPTGYSARVGRFVWHEMTVRTTDGRKWLYYLRRDYGSYAGKFSIL